MQTVLYEMLARLTRDPVFTVCYALLWAVTFAGTVVAWLARPVPPGRV